MTLTKDEKHNYFFINDGWLCESYNTIRGQRWRHKLEVPGHIDVDMISDALLTKTLNIHVADNPRSLKADSSEK